MQEEIHKTIMIGETRSLGPSFDLSENHHSAIMAPTGSGMTTLLELCATGHAVFVSIAQYNIHNHMKRIQGIIGQQ